MSTITLTAPTTKTPAAALDAIALLKADHGTVKGLFAFYEKMDSTKYRKSLVVEICSELSVHAQIEEEIFYPAVKSALHDRLPAPEATTELENIKDLIAQLECLEPDGELYDARVKVLSEYVEHHVKEEQNEMFPRVRASSLDLVELGARMATRKTELRAARS